MLPAVGALLAGALRPWLVLALVCGGFSLSPQFSHVFWTREYLPNILQQAATNIILAVGMTFVILTAGIDLSVGSVLALCGVALGLSAKGAPPLFLAGIMACPAGALCGYLVALPLIRRNAPAAAVWTAAGATAIAVTGAGALLVARASAGGLPLAGAILAALAAGTGCGLINGLITALGRVPS